MTGEGKALTNRCLYLTCDDGLGDEIEVKREGVFVALGFIFEKAMQNHKLHESWNEGANGEFITCIRGDCMEAKIILGDWGWNLG